MTEPLPPAEAPSRSSVQALAARAGAVVAAGVFVTFSVMSVSRAAFTASTSNDANSATTGAVVLSDSDGGTALFTLDEVSPDTDEERCIHVDYRGGFDSGDVKLYATPVDPATEIGDLASFLELEIDRIPSNDTLFQTALAAPTTSCAVFDTLTLAGATPTPIPIGGAGTLADVPGDQATGLTAMPGTEATYLFRFRVTVADDPAAGGTEADWNFVWETTSG